MSHEPLNKVKAKVVEKLEILVLYKNILCYMSNALAFLFFFFVFGSFFLEPNLYVEKLDKTILADYSDICYIRKSKT